MDTGATTTAALRLGAARVLHRNWTGTSTVPSHTLYPHQWSWDSAFIAVGLRHLSVRRAMLELETLLGAQWGDGRIPHIVFNPAVPPDAYFPDPGLWRSSAAGAAAGAPAGTETSGLVQPPVHALAAWLVHRSAPAAAGGAFPRRVYPRLAAWHRYLTGSRDLGGGGLAAIVHPWESGMDNSPCWDGPLERIRPAAAGSFQRADLHHGDPADRPTDLDYGRYVRLVAEYRDGGYADAGGGVRHGFAVEDPCLNALLIVSEHALADLAAAAGGAGAGAGAGAEAGAGAGAARAHRARAARLTAALVERLWDGESGIFRCRDLVSGELIAERSVSGLVPLIVPGLPREVVEALLGTLAGEHFRLGPLPLVPSYDLRGRAFDRARYWRGPAWFNVNWLLERGLRLHAATAEADALRAAMLAAAGATGFAEYADAFTGEARGTRGFGWTAALTLDLAMADADGGVDGGSDPGVDAAADVAGAGGT